MLNRDYHGKGYAYEAAKAFFDYLFNEKGARRIYAYTEDYNLSSQYLCEKLGMRREGLFREFVSFINDADGKKYLQKKAILGLRCTANYWSSWWQSMPTMRI